MPPPAASPRPSLGSVSGLLDAYSRQPERLLEVLHELQATVGFLRPEDLRAVAQGLGVPAGRVLGVATFYPHFRLTPPPRHRCAVCVGTACSIHGAAATGAVLAARLTDVPSDRIAWEQVSCVGACGVAPVVVYDGVVAARQSAPEVLARVETWS